MQLTRLQHPSDYVWQLPPQGQMRVPAVFFAGQALMEAMDDKVAEQISNVAGLPGIVGAAFAMPDAHWGYGFPIGGVAAFDAEKGGVVSGGGVGFDISCGVRTLHTGMTVDEVLPVAEQLADELAATIPAGVGSTGALHLTNEQMEAMLAGGAAWAVEAGYGEPADLEYTEERGCMDGARPEHVSRQARKRQRNEMGTLGSGNHYLEVQQVMEVYDREAADAFDLREGDIQVSIHCGSRGMGHQIGTEFLREMVVSAPEHGIELPERELACAPIKSDLGQRYLGAMRAGTNCALANRQIITHLARRAFETVLPRAHLTMLYDVSHNTCKAERHWVDGEERELYIHRKGATRAYGPGHPSLPGAYTAVGQPVLIGGTMGTESFILAGTQAGMRIAFGSACHGAGRAMSRRQAKKSWQGEQISAELARRGILIRSASWRGVAEEAPEAYKDVRAVAEASEQSGLARRVARLEPVICVKG